MFMVCWHYCMPFLNFLYFAIAPIMILWGAFVMKRGINLYKRPLRDRALILWALAIVKICVLDIRGISIELFCDSVQGCSTEKLWAINIFSLLCLGGGAYIWWRLCKKFRPDREGYISRPTNQQPLVKWTRMSVLTVSLFVIWVSGPWVTSLTMGSIPKLFLIFSWPYMSVLALVSLLMAFWKLEDFQWLYSSTKSRIADKKKVWIPKDTLWTLVFIYGFTVMLAFASSRMIDEAAARL
ncbi:MAG: hypothetical protein ACQEQL_02815 [Pseudomonadota bacterium]